MPPGLEVADAGSIYVGGATSATLRPVKRDIAMVFQNYALYPYMSVAQNMASR